MESVCLGLEEWQWEGGEGGKNAGVVCHSLLQERLKTKGKEGGRG